MATVTIEKGAWTLDVAGLLYLDVHDRYCVNEAGETVVNDAASNETFVVETIYLLSMTVICADMRKSSSLVLKRVPHRDVYTRLGLFTHWEPRPDNWEKTEVAII